MSDPTISLDPLRPYMDAKATKQMRDYDSSPTDQIVGWLGSTYFIVTLDSDGQCEASLSTRSGKPTEAQIRAFWRLWGVEPAYPTPRRILRGKALHWVVRKGVPH